MEQPSAYFGLLRELLRRLWDTQLEVAMFLARGWLMILGMVAGVRGAENDWDDITDNLFTDLAPLLALFGERVTTQFISQAIGWEDCIMLAMAPLGVLTIVISAIRVGGPMWMKAIIGRARENIAAAEMEVMSSTSTDVCELNNGAGIVRCQGTSPVLEFICVMPEAVSVEVGEQCKFESITLDEALQQGKLIKTESWNPFSACKHWLLSWARLSSPEARTEKDFTTGVSTSQSSQHSSPWLRSRFNRERGSDIEMTLSPEELDVPPAESIKSASSPTITIIHDTRPEAPNLSLNLQNSSDRTEIRYFAFLGILLQLAVLAFLVAMTYHPTFKLEFQRDESLAPEYAFAMTMGGSIALVIGLLICSYVVEVSTDEELYSLPDGGSRIKLYWLQQEQTVNDQGFGSIATYPKGCQSVVTMSRRRKHTKPGFGLETRTLLGTIIAMIGFVVQFIGFRGMHSAASTSQLVAVGIMTLLRAWLRRNLAKRIHQTRLVPKHELDWLAMELQQLSEDVSLPGSPTTASTGSGQQNQQRSFGSWEVDPSWDCTYEDVEERVKQRSKGSSNSSGSHHNHASSAQRVFELRRNLGSLVQIRGHSVADAVNLADAINSSQDTLYAPLAGSDHHPDSHTWFLPVIYTPPGSSIPRPERVKIVAQSSHTDERVTAEQMDAVISLWTYAAVTSSLDADTSESGDTNNTSNRRRKYENYLRGSLAPQGFMVVGTFTRQTMWPLIHNLLWWAPRGTDELLRIEKRVPGNSSLSIKGHSEWQEPSRKSLQRRSNTIEASHLVGCPSHQIETTAQQATPQHTKQDSSHQILASTMDDDLALFRQTKGQMLTDKESGKTEVTFALSCDDELEKLYSKALLLNFLNSASRQLLQPINGEIEVRRANDGHKGYPYLGNATLTQLTDIIVQAGYGLDQAACVMLISALWPTGVLPLPTMVFDHPTQFHEQIMAEIEVEGHWMVAMDNVAATWTDFFSGILSQMYGNKYFLTKGLAFMMEIVLLFEEQQEIDEAIVIPDLSKNQRWASKEHDYLPDLLKTEIRDGGKLHEALRVVAAELQSQGRNLPRLASETLPKKYPIDNNATPSTKDQDTSDSHDRPGDSEISSDVNLEDYERDGKSISGWLNWHFLAISPYAGGGPFLPSYKESDLAVQDLRGYTPLHYASERASVSTVRALLNGGASPFVTALDGKNPLHVAARAGRADVVELLLFTINSTLSEESQKRSVVLAEDHQFWRPVHWAVFSGNVDTLLILSTNLNMRISEDAKVIRNAIILDKVNILDRLVADIFDRAEHVDWYLMILDACRFGNWDVVRKLTNSEARNAIEGDCDPDSLSTAFERFKDAIPTDVLFSILPSHSSLATFDKGWARCISQTMSLAAEDKNSQYVALLLQWLQKLPVSGGRAFRQWYDFSPAKISTVFNYQTHPLHTAVRAVAPRNVRILLEAGAEPNAKGPGGKAALEFIRTAEEPINEHDLLEVVQSLVEFGAHIDASDNGLHGWFRQYPQVWDYLIDT